MQALQRAQQGALRKPLSHSRRKAGIAYAAAKQPKSDPRAARLARILRQYEGAGERRRLQLPRLPARLHLRLARHPAP